jgi:hypothetical protein
MISQATTPHQAGAPQLHRSGRTAAQMQAAPRHAIFVWCNNHIEQAQRLARHLGREDLCIVRPGWLESGLATLWQAVVFDHAGPAHYTHAQWQGALRIQERMERMAAELAAPPLVPDQADPQRAPALRERHEYDTARGTAVALVDVTPDPV